MYFSQIIVPVLLLLSFTDSSSTSNPVNFLYPSWSPDGKSIACSFKKDSIYQIGVINIKTNKLRQVTNLTKNASWPSWSYDGRRIYFDTDANGNRDIFSTDTKGKNLEQHTYDTSFDAVANTAHKSNWIIYDSDKEPDKLADVYALNLKTRKETKLTTGPNSNAHGSLSPDDTKIVLKVREQKGVEELYVMNIDGSEMTRLTNRKCLNLHPVFSPDGKSIVFSSNQSGNFELYLLLLKDLSLKQLTNNKNTNYRPTFSPDGTNILFCTRENQVWKLCIIDTNGNIVRYIQPVIK